MTRPKPAILSILAREDLKHIVDDLEIDGVDWRSVEGMRAAFEAFRGHPDYRTTDDEGNPHDIFSERVHLDLSVPSNYGTLIKLLQDLPPLTDNKDKPILDGTKQRKGTLADIAGDVLGRAFDVFLRHKFEKEGIGIYLTPSPVKRAMVEMALHDIETYDYGIFTTRDADGRPSFRMCDPAGGSGGFLVALLPELRRVLDRMNLTDEERESLWGDMLEHSFVASDSSARMVRLARLNMALHGAPRARIFNTSTSLLTELLKPNSFDLILTNPPFGAPKAKEAEEKKAVAELMSHFRTDIDFDAIKGKGGLLRPSPGGLAMGANPNSKDVWQEKDKGVDLSVLFLDRCLQLLKPGGRLLMIVPDSILCNANTRHVREYMIGKKDPETGEFHGGKAIVRGVISLPADTFKLSGTGAKTSILYVQKRTADKNTPDRFVDEPQSGVFMAVADTLGYSVKNNTEVYDVPNELVPIAGAYRRGE
jgi:type I restriction enzyme M protein